MMKRIDHVAYQLKCLNVVRVCDKCRRRIRNEPYLRKLEYTRTALKDIWLCCWRCCHTNEETLLFLNEYPRLFERVKSGRSYYLKLRPKGFEFPSDSGENDEEW